MMSRYRKTAASASEAPCNYRTPPRPAVRHSGCRCARLASPAGEAEGPLTIIVLRASPPRGCLGRCLESGGETVRRGAHRAIGVWISAGRRAWAMVGGGSRKRDGNGNSREGSGDILGQRGGGGRRAPAHRKKCTAVRGMQAPAAPGRGACAATVVSTKPGCAHYKMPGLSRV